MELQLTDIVVLSLSRTRGRFELVVGDEKFNQNICEFMLTFASMAGKNMPKYMSNLDNEFDNVRVPLSGAGKAVTLPLCDFARLRSLYMQQMFEMKLEDMLMRQGISREQSVSLD